MDDVVRDLILELAEGNPGALRVLAELSQQPDGVDDLLELKRQGVKGSLVWLRYKDVCAEDIDSLRENIRVTALEHQLPAPGSGLDGLSLG